MNNMGQITEMIQKSHDTAKLKGWHDEKRTFGELIVLCHSELSEALVYHRNGFENSEILYEADKHGKLKPIGIPSELADVCIRIFDMCGLYGIDLENAILEKMEYNQKRDYRHGNKVL